MRDEIDGIFAGDKGAEMLEYVDSKLIKRKTTGKRAGRRKRGQESIEDRYERLTNDEGSPFFF